MWSSALSLVLALAASPAEPAASPALALTATPGQAVALKDGIQLTVRIVPAEKFEDVRVDGVPVVVELAFDAGDQNPLLVLEPGPEPKSSALQLEVASQRFAPRALTDTLPPPPAQLLPKRPWLTSRLEISRKTGRGFSMMLFSGKMSVLLLFDVPPALAAEAKRLHLGFKIADQLYTVQVALGS